MSDNPYSAPRASVGSVATGHEVRMYSPVQVACGTIGGPVGLVYFLWANFVALGRHAAARRTLVFGTLFLVAVIAAVAFLPDGVPGSVFTVGYIVIAHTVAQQYQMSKQAIADSPMHDFQSGWRVLGIGLLCLVASMLVMLGPVWLLIDQGWVQA